MFPFSRFLVFLISRFAFYAGVAQYLTVSTNRTVRTGSHGPSDQPTNQPTGPPIDQPPTNRPTYQPTNRPTGLSAYEYAIMRMSTHLVIRRNV